MKPKPENEHGRLPRFVSDTAPPPLATPREPWENVPTVREMIDHMNQRNWQIKVAPEERRGTRRGVANK